MRLLILTTLCACVAGPTVAAEFRPAQHTRRPVAVVLSEDGRTLLAANRSSGTISRIDPAARRVTGESPAGKSLADLAPLGSGRYAAVDDKACQMILLADRHGELRVTGRAAAQQIPVSVAAHPDGSRAVVAALWAQQLEVFDTSGDVPKRLRRIDLSFAPRAQRLLPDGNTLIVAAAFGGRLAVVDLRQGTVVARRELHGHNIRHLALAADGQTLLIPHQVLNPGTATTAEGVHWGGVMKNVLRDVTLAELKDDDVDVPSSRNSVYLGDPSRATGDPSHVLVTRAGVQVLSVSGVNEVDITDAGNNYQRIAVGRRPTAMALSADQREVYVACTSDDAIAVLDVARRRLIATIELGPPRSSGEPDGEALFFDARLASDGWYSCHSCHTDGHSNGLTNDNSSDDSFGAPKRILSLLGSHETGPWAWNGRADKLEQQIRTSITKTMQGPAPTDEQVKSLAAYLRTLPRAPSLAAARGDGNPQAIARGRAVFQRSGCADCHAGENYTHSGTFDVGLADERGRRRFNPPSLRGVSQRERLLHDNRALSLREVFTRHRHPDGTPLPARDLDDLLEFLRSL